MTKQGNYINHVALVLDASSSMDYSGHTKTVIKVADEQVKHLAKKSQELDQETRVTIYSFADQPKCLVYDKDVLRLPSVADLYKPYGNTALIDATHLAIEDLEMQPEKYGEHSFLVYVLTDGRENRSRNLPSALQRKLDRLPDHWTVAALVPNAEGESWCKRVGFTPGNIAIWDASSQAGLEDSFVRIRNATDSFMLGRQSGIRGTRSLFSMDPSTLNRETIKQAHLTPLPSDRYQVLNVLYNDEIRPFVEGHGIPYRAGQYYYELSKSEKVQPQKQIAVMDRQGRVYTGPNARQLVGLPDYEVRVRPDFNPDYRLFVQSTSVNRKLVPGTKLLRLV